MKPVDQDRFHDKEAGTRGNCMQAAVASLLGLPLADVPDFLEARDRGSHEELALGYWLEGLGFDMIRLPGNHCPDAYYLASGPASRGVHHMVVMKAGELAHDPHPSRAGLLKADHVYVLVPMRPADALKGMAP
ncbi:hypothetical protein M5E06_17820 [Azospirillum sp. A1-3]|uniref:hypothetical protein n=1 Tax=Azospirillum sp. A1-3 TaxID=185874 RepID=UPI002077596E|nr:hypothetical protein [Azospirillum sp. A1-3]MCM8735994.1 hypothetical protein [Azospirillum sp. A1-3]